MPKKVVAEGSAKAPKGYFVVYVGSKMARYVVPTYYLRSAIFQELLDKAADEYGYDVEDKLVLPCDERTFNGVLTTLAAKS